MWWESISYLRLSLQINLTFLSLKMDFSFVIEEPEHESLEEKKRKDYVKSLIFFFLARGGFII